MSPAQAASPPPWPSWRDHADTARGRVAEVQLVSAMMAELFEDADPDAAHPARLAALFAMFESHAAVAIENLEMCLEAH